MKKPMIKTSSIIRVIVVIFASGCSTVETADLTPNIRDEGSITMGGNDPIIHFLVSHNVDDDDNDNDGSEDKTEAIPNANEDNLRALKFNMAGAKTAALGAPQFNDATGRMANNVLIRAWKEDRQTPFPFNVPQPLPLTVYFEGIKNIGSVDQFFFEYGYEDNNGLLVGQGLAYGTVVDVKTETKMKRKKDTDLLEQNRRLLLKAGAKTKAAVSPKPGLQVRWRHSRLDFSNPRSVQTSLVTKGFTSRTSPGELFSVTVNLAGQEGSIVAEGPLAVVGPSNVEVVRWSFPPTWTGGIFGTATRSNNDHTVNWLSVNHSIPYNERRAKILIWDLFDGRVYYRILDQFDNPIIEAPYDGAEIMIREDVPLASLMPPNPNLISDLVAALADIVRKNTTPDWTAAPVNGVFADYLNVFMSPSMIMVPQQIHVVVPANQNFIGMAGHKWHVSVGKNGTTYRVRRVTNNNLTVQVESLSSPQAPGVLQTRAVYNVVLP